MRIKVKAHPKSKQRKVKMLSKESFEVWVHELPEQNKANNAIIELIAEYLDLSKSEVILKSGATTKLKVFELHGNPQFPKDLFG